MGEHRPADEPVAVSAKPEAFAMLLSRPRAWGAAALIVGGYIWFELKLGHSVVEELWLAPMIVSAGLVVALVARRSWARALLLGFSAWLALALLQQWLETHPSIHVDQADSHWFFGVACLLYAATAVLLAPWRRCELHRQGWVLALIAFASHGAWFLSLGEGALGDLAILAVLFSVIGGLLRAPWAGVPSLVAGIMLGLAVTAWWWTSRRHFGYTSYALTGCLSPAACKALTVASIALFYASALAALLAGIMGRQSSRPFLRSVGEDAGPFARDMRRRWGLVFASAMTSLVAMSMIAGSFRALWHGGIPVMGACTCAAIGVWGAMANVRRRWPAVAAVVVSLSVVLDLGLPHGLGRGLEHTGAPGIVFLVGTAATALSALAVAIRRFPTPSPIPVAHRF